MNIALSIKSIIFRFSTFVLFVSDIGMVELRNLEIGNWIVFWG